MKRELHNAFLFPCVIEKNIKNMYGYYLLNKFIEKIKIY